MKANKMWKTCLLVACVIALGTSYFFFNPCVKKLFTIYNFRDDIANMQKIVREWESLDYVYMFIDMERYDLNTIDVGYKQNENTTIGGAKECLRRLLVDKKYRYIMKDDNAIYFTKYASLGNGYGVAFSVDGRSPKNEFVIFNERIDDYVGWYYYIMR